jgi:hypothetical protein
MRFRISPTLRNGVFSCMLLWAGTVYAAEYEPIKFGSFLLTPKLTIEQSYDDNIFSTEDDEETDFIMAVKPSLVIEKSYRDHQFAFEAEGRGAQILGSFR